MIMKKMKIQAAYTARIVFYDGIASFSMLNVIVPYRTLGIFFLNPVPSE